MIITEENIPRLNIDLHDFQLSERELFTVNRIIRANRLRRGGRANIREGDTGRVDMIIDDDDNHDNHMLIVYSDRLQTNLMIRGNEISNLSLQEG